MKTKKFSKKLVLRKNTIVNLDDSQMDHLRGGLTGENCTEGGITCTCYETYKWENCPLTSNPRFYPTVCVTEIDQCC